MEFLVHVFVQSFVELPLRLAGKCIFNFLNVDMSCSPKFLSRNFLAVLVMIFCIVLVVCKFVGWSNFSQSKDHLNMQVVFHAH